MRTRSALVASLLLPVMGACGGTATESTLSQEQLTQLTERFQTRLDELYEAAKSTDEVFPGATAAFILPDGKVVAVATGFSDVEEEIPMDPDMRMPSGSIGKTYVATTAISLAHDGVFDLDDKISKWIGEEEWFPRLPNGPDITIRHLLSHSSGLLDHVFASDGFAARVKELAASGDPDRYLSPLELVDFVLDLDPLFPAGKGFNYTDTGYLVAGLVMEKASGSTYYEELRSRVLDPLGLEFTLPQDRRSVPDLSQGYAVASAQLFGTPVRIVEDGAMMLNPAIEWTGGGLYNNPQDLVRFFKLLCEGDALPEPYLEDLLESVAQEGVTEASRVYSLGIGIAEDERGTSYGHSGFFPGYNSRAGYFADHGVAVAIQINTDQSNVSEHFDALAQVVLDALP